MLVDDTEVHEQVRRHHVELEVIALHRQLGALAHRLEQRLQQRPLRERVQLDELGHELGQRHQPRARALMQALDQRHHLGLQHAGHQPVAALLADLVERVDRHGDGHAVLGIARRVQVGGGAVDAAEADRLREGRGGDAGGLVAHQLVARQMQQLRVELLLMAVPALEARAADHLLRQLRVVVGEDQVLVDQNVLAARLVLQLLDLADHLLVVRQERQPRLPLATHQRLADEDLARGHRVDQPEVHPALVVDDDAVERGALEGDHLARLLLPVRLE